MRLRERPRPFARRFRVGGDRRPGGFGRLKMALRESERAVVVSKGVSLTATLFLMGMLVYAIFKFFEMIRLRGLDLWPLAFVPAAIVIILLLLVRLARSLIREIAARSSSE